MIILSLRTDKEQAEVGLHENNMRLGYIKWPAHRTLSKTILLKIKIILDESSISLTQVQGIVVFAGPGSFTGLRIGLSVANALAGSLGVPIVARSGKNWLKRGTADLQDGQNDKIALPEYGQAARTTSPRK
ncbi:tRNA (adenosine(37)-N6)-threonylcarbamoyltransferase complex dimerization subunit type 1 TsaB [Candidatus Saccharibacteria bacterium RIFCSPLOWO2_01_FULL_48_13]|nr:MAG: tRNA (adenosine(37)-N6)-threonylcarbamoyltransferase complex dimerization subunit type 1 TsaB [Candidatus Saccharibacteria bacterium RIFCSPHIGHO2_01_FULL_48_12]OGL36755.1 MAG: tRNA (adenosine(37)-N6)-threonylcarbamoyltransferase complex dimerization subunit type 1 TsaB [Candidatus Saccharibacteria bacterium RIFCSPLOWO2_01_FULL_48_13]